MEQVKHKLGEERFSSRCRGSLVVSGSFSTRPRQINQGELINITRPLVAAALLTVLISACSQTPVPSSDPIDLSAQRLGTATFDSVVDVAVDRNLGAVYAVGGTGGSLDGANQGGFDVFLRRYNRNGTVVWKRQLGGALRETAGGIAVSPSGAVFVSYTQTEGA